MTVQNVKRLAVIDGETLMDTRLPKRSFCVETLLPEGISMLGGAPKVGKSWMVLLLANKVPMKMIQDWLGHSDMSTTANIYSHVDHTSKLESAKVIGNLLGA